MPDPLESIVNATTSPGRAALVPEIALQLASDATGIFSIIEQWERDGARLPPYWAFAWPGGQAVARHLLDHRAEVAGRRIIDIGAGSGIAAIAAALAGARHVIAADIDPLAAAACRLNAASNGVALETTTADVLGAPPEADLIVIGDLVYEPEIATRVAACLEAAARTGIAVLVADRTSARRPSLAMTLVATYDAPLTPALPAHPSERARLWRLDERVAGRRR